MKTTPLKNIPNINPSKVPQNCKVCEHCLCGFEKESDIMPCEVFCNIGKDIMKDGVKCERKVNPIVIAYRLKG